MQKTKENIGKNFYSLTLSFEFLNNVVNVIASNYS